MSTELKIDRARLTKDARSFTIGGTHGTLLNGRFQGKLYAGGNQDRYAAAEWEMRDGKWKFAAVFDGHGGSAAAEYVASTLPLRLQDSLASALEAQSSLEDAAVSTLLSETLIKLDDQIKADLIALFPVDIETVSDSDTASGAALFDPSGKPRIEVERAVSGTTAVVALIDPSNGVHVAVLGDSDAFLCVHDGKEWTAQLLGSESRQTCFNEAARIRAEHPNEPNCIFVQSEEYSVYRLLGSLILSRALGDMHFKLSASQNRLLKTAFPNSIYDLDDPNIVVTPPYLSNTPDVVHAHIPGQKFLVLASDGLAGAVRSAHKDSSISKLLEVCATSPAPALAAGRNMAEEVLWNACGGDHIPGNRYSYTSPMTESQFSNDDITILVVPL